MRYFIFALLWFASPAVALTPSDLWGAPLVQEAPCRDHESGDQGHCYIVEYNGVTLLVFHDQEGARFIRRVLPGQPYETVWHRDTGAPVPSGISL